MYIYNIINIIYIICSIYIIYIYIYIIFIYYNYIFIYYKDFSSWILLVFLEMLTSYNVWNIKKPWNICDRLWIYTITNLQAFLKWSLDYWDEKFSRLGEAKWHRQCSNVACGQKNPEKMNLFESNYWKLNNWLYTTTASRSPGGKCSVKVSGQCCSKSSHFFNFNNVI